MLNENATLHIHTLCLCLLLLSEPLSRVSDDIESDSSLRQMSRRNQGKIAK